MHLLLVLLSLSVSSATTEQSPVSTNAPEEITLCPKNFCLAPDFLNKPTCLYPNPDELKKCYDKFCKKNVSPDLKPITYCKQWQDQDGRVCQGTSNMKCKCADERHEDPYLTVEGATFPPNYEKAVPCEFSEPSTTPSLDTTRRRPGRTTVNPADNMTAIGNIGLVIVLITLV